MAKFNTEEFSALRYKQSSLMKYGNIVVERELEYKTQREILLLTKSAEEETGWLKRLSSLAQEEEITLIASYVVILSDSPFRFENNYIMFAPDGKK